MVLLGIALSVFVLVAILGASVYFLFYLKEPTADTQQQRPPAAQRAPPGQGRRRRLRERRRVVAEQESSSEDDVSEDEDEEEAEDVGSRQRRINAYEERRRERDAEREAQEEEETAERLRKAEERRQLEEQEAEKWAEFITVEERGEVEEDNEQDLLEQFVELIKTRKIVILEDLAVEFGIRTQEVIQRISSLEASGRLTGVMDDRGKYVYISAREMESVAEYIVGRGRVSIRELAEESHRFIDLETQTVSVVENPSW